MKMKLHSSKLIPGAVGMCLHPVQSEHIAPIIMFFFTFAFCLLIWCHVHATNCTIHHKLCLRIRWTSKRNRIRTLEHSRPTNWIIFNLFEATEFVAHPADRLSWEQRADDTNPLETNIVSYSIELAMGFVFCCNRNDSGQVADVETQDWCTHSVAWHFIIFCSHFVPETSRLRNSVHLATDDRPNGPCV